MRKLPVFATLGNAIAFLFTRYFTVFRITWFPFALLLLVTLVAPLLIGLPFVDFPLVIDENETNPLKAVLQMWAEVWDRFALLICLQLLLQVLVMASVAVAVHRIILFGDTKPGVYFAFPFGWTEVLFVVMGVLYVLMALALLAVFLVPAFALVVQSNPDLRALIENLPEVPSSPPVVDPVSILPLWVAYFVGLLFFLWVALRLWVWPPAIVATNRLSLGTAWRLTKGNALRVLGLLILTVIVIWFLLVVIVAALVAAGVTAFLAFDLSADIVRQEVQDMVRNARDIRTMIRLQQDLMAPFLPLLFLVELVLNVLIVAFTVALLSYSYKALMGYPAREPIPQAA